MKRIENSRTEAGSGVSARQRKKGKAVDLQRARLSIGPEGSLIVAANVGDERGLLIGVAIALDEILAWLPDLVAKARQAPRVGRVDEG